MSSQIDYIISLVNVINKANIIYWSLIKCKKVTRTSVLAAKLYGIVHGFDIKVVIKAILEKIPRSSIPLILCIKSEFLYNCLVKLGIT